MVRGDHLLEYGRTYDWLDPGIPYRLDSHLNVWENDGNENDENDATVLKIYPGTIVQFNENKYLKIGNGGNERGALDARGVTFTTVDTSKVWSGIDIYDGAIDSTVIDSNIIEYANRAFEIHSGATPVIKNNTIRYNTDYGIYSHHHGRNTRITGNTFLENPYIATFRVVDLDSTFYANTYTNNTNNVIVVRDGHLSEYGRTYDWLDPGIPYRLDSDLNVFDNDGNENDENDATVLKIYSGTTVQFNENKYLQIGNGGIDRGALDARGVTFTSSGEYKWDGIKMVNGIAINHSNIINTTIEKANTGLLVDNDNYLPLIEKSTFRFNEVGFKIQSVLGTSATVGGADSKTNTFYNNETAGIYNNTDTTNTTTNHTLIATYNNWGDKDGPRHINNPAGKGDSIIGKVEYYPWRIAQAVESFTLIQGLFGITLNWTPSSTQNLTKYNIYRSSNSTTPVFHDSVAANINVYSDNNVERGKTYYYWIAPVDYDGEGVFSSVISGSISSFDLVLSYPNRGVDSLNVVWQVHADTSVALYYIYAGSHQDSTVMVDSLAGDSTRFIYKNLMEAEEYFFKFRARNAEGSYTTFTNIDSAFTHLIAPNNLSSKMINKNQIELTWEDSTSKEDGYKIEQTVQGINNWNEVDSVAKDEQAVIAIKLDPATAYSFRVRAYTKAGAVSNYSNTATDTTERDPNIPYGSIINVAGLEGIKSDTISIKYQLKLDTGKNSKTIDWEYSLDGTEWVALGEDEILNNSLRAPGEHQIEWLSLINLDGIDDEEVWFRMKYTDNEFTSSFIYSKVFYLDNNLPPNASILPVIGEQTGDVTIQYTTEDVEADNVSLTGEFSIDEGTNWAVAEIEYTVEGASTKAATATITFNVYNVPNIDDNLTIISTDGTSVTYVWVGSADEDASLGKVHASNTATTQVTSLKSAIEHSNNHGGKITVTQDNTGLILTLTQVAHGEGGNTTVTYSGASSLMTTTNFTGGALSGENSGNITWKALGDVSTGFEDSVLFKVTPKDKDKGQVSNQIIINLDYNQPPTIGITNISSPQISEVPIGYTITDQEQDTIRLEVNYNLGFGWKQATIVENLDTITTYSNILTWASMEDVDPILYPTIQIQIVPYDNDPGVPAISNDFQLDNNQLPKSYMLTQGGDKSNDIKLVYQLADKQKDNISFIPSYSIDQGVQWLEATVIGQKDNVILSDTLIQDTLTWKSFTDLPEKDINELFFRIVPSDANGEGFARVVSIFHLDNNTPPEVVISGLTGEQSGQVKIEYKITDISVNDNISLSGKYSIDNGLNWSDAIFPTQVENIISSLYNSSFEWDSKAQTEGIDQQQFQLIIIPSDLDPGTPDTVVFHLDNEVGPTLVSFTEKFTPIPVNPIRLEFSRPIKRNSVMGTIQVVSEAVGELNDLNFTYENDDKVINVFSTNGMPALDKLTVTVENELKDTDEKGFDGNQNGDPENSIIDDTTFTVETYLGADFDQSGKIGQSDITILVNAWNVDDFDYEIGPATGTMPNLRSKPDQQYNIEDFMTFIRYWNWAKVNNIVGKVITGTFDDQNFDIIDTGGKIHFKPYLIHPISDFHLSINRVDPRVQIVDPIVNQNPKNGSHNTLMVSTIDTLINTYDYFMGFIGLNNMVEVDSILFQLPIKIRGRDPQHIEILYEYTMDGQHFTGKRLVTVEPIPETFALGQNFPNPFNPITNIFYDLPVDSKIELVIYDILGRKVITLINGFQEKGYKTVKWKGLDQNGIKVSSGIYFYRLLSEDYMATKKMIYLK